MTGLVETFRDLLVEWLEDSHLFPTRNLHIDLILNPGAGALRHRRQCKALLTALREAKAGKGSQNRPDRNLHVSCRTTEYPGHETAILDHLGAEPAPPGDLRLIVIAGGDGTSRGALISVLDLEPSLRQDLFFFRLPLGTGNDAAETRDWATALAVLSGGDHRFTIKALPVLEVRIPGQPLHYSFNIASVGLDAFVVHLTNKMKSWFPGNSYSLMVDLAAFFYEAFVRVVPTTIELTLHGKPVLKWQDRFLLAALGTTGHRTYGAGKRILPDDDNFCLAGKKNLLSKLALRRPFYEGTHRNLAGITLARGDFLKIDSPVRIPLQMDGEVLWLAVSDFPITLTIADRGLKVLSPEDSAKAP